ncbi:unnamed protein product [Rotaria magnacalcarata]|uniref:DYW domain-containing protein n=4 Tax=Rotaria magnacalcarata TaxID=392030 RepID=A0A815A1L3_9BILA|nr:unnamed protein product [Rotaria magnacalcarata]
MKTLIDSKEYKKALNLLYEHYDISTDFTKNMAIKACIRLHDYNEGHRILQKLSPTSLNDPYIQTSLIHFYMQSHKVDKACHLFSTIVNKSNPMYAAMFKGFITNKMPEKVLDLYDKMEIEPINVTLNVLFNACARIRNDRAKTIGKRLLEKNFNYDQNDTVVFNSAIHMLMRFRDVNIAEDVFHQMKNKDIYTYGTMIKGYNDNQEYEKALDLYEKMNVKPNEMIYTLIFNSCAQLSNDRAKTIGKKFLEQMPDIYRNNTIVLTSAIHMLMKFGDVSNAEHIFQLNREKNIVIYGAIMNGYCINHEPLKCLNIFNEIKQSNLVPDEIVFNIAISACSQIGILSRCQTVADQIPVHMQRQLFIQNALINMWGKSGSFVKAQQIFESVSNPNIITYNSMINVYGLNGMGSEAIELFKHVPTNERDDISYICALNACSHSGLLAEARIIFNQVPTKTEKIITTMIDCLCRLFLFDEAEKLIDNYEKTNSPYVVMYMAMLSGARNHRNSQLCGKIYNRMKSLFPDEKQSLISGAVLLSNVYSSVGEYEQANDIRSYQRKELGVKVKAGMSWTEINGELAQFTAHDHSHPRSAEIFAEFDRLAVELIQHGHTFDGSWITRPINNDETIQSVLCGHSEKLAIGLNLIQRPVPSIIQVTKNLRICGDCHSVTKLIAKIRQVDIIIRDANRVHHFFQNGQCSCQDHF